MPRTDPALLALSRILRLVGDLDDAGRAYLVARLTAPAPAAEPVAAPAPRPVEVGGPCPLCTGPTDIVPGVGQVCRAKCVTQGRAA